MKISSVTSVKVLDIGIVPGFQIAIIIAEGTVSTSGWTHPRLVPCMSFRELEDDIFDIEFVADEPSGMVLQVIRPVTAEITLRLPEWAKRIRVHGQSGFIEEVFKAKGGDYGHYAPSLVAGADALTPVIFKRNIASYEDSHQPTGTVHWKNDGPFGLSIPHPEMKKLVHNLSLIIEGPDEEKIRKCVNDALSQGVFAGIIAAFVTGGIGVIEAFLATVTASLTACIGGGTVKFADDSHWEYWVV